LQVDSDSDGDTILGSIDLEKGERKTARAAAKKRQVSDTDSDGAEGDPMKGDGKRGSKSDQPEADKTEEEGKNSLN